MTLKSVYGVWKNWGKILRIILNPTAKEVEMISKSPILPDRIRKVPKQFSWIDHRLVRERHIEHCSHSAAALYLFLVTVGDAQGMSYYSDASLMGRLSMDGPTLTNARNNLIQIGLIAWRKPLYQVLSLNIRRSAKPRGPNEHPLALGEIFKQTMGGAS
jgi:hypothetical protein